MDYKIDYELTAKIEIINEFSYGIYNRLLNYILNNGIDKNGSNLYSAILSTLRRMLSIDLFSYNRGELDKMLIYWKNMNQYINEITDKVKTQPV
ncbi:hypothetical protein P7D98_08200 [Enterococcus avium]|uniref:Antitoxin epsilon/PezA domain-containing protein n=1 Tax=Enterococcus dispar ATCC 51266 TaxID=1139219 RepID=S0KL36_9ENTE|nr:MULTISPECIES: hypothetical protein [Enterococcus]EOT40763.1 hypothetical protein OMK_01678 [Enterococcus dispar ATCC 51266]EOW86864.1 hypothetical protein I569_02228 [Enterococcus dispar ATCC 51266]MDT2435627.1 hypothetical protein [Enterococcus avium]MDT2448280.1 hypothetical protein [Enterococcus avium]MDT2465639.1 hypothetical protein [Enterococcus avium]